MKPKHLLFTLCAVILFSCGPADPNKHIDEGLVRGERYTSKEIGWSIEIPANWKIVSRDKLENLDEKGKAAIEKTAEMEVNTKMLKHLISFQKDAFNIFSSTSEPYQEASPGEYQQNNQLLYEIIYKTFADQGIQADTSSGKELIHGLEFNTFYTTIYDLEGKVILRQILYSRLINGYDFGVNINYNNEEDKTTMLNVWKRSKFTRH